MPESGAYNTIESLGQTRLPPEAGIGQNFSPVLFPARRVGGQAPAERAHVGGQGPFESTSGHM